MIRNRMKSILRHSAPLLLSALLISFAAVSAMAEGPSESQVKAAFLFNFAKFIDWPAGAFAGPGDLFVFGVLGDDPVGDSVQQLTGKTVQGRTVAVRRYESLRDVTACHVLYIARSDLDEADAVTAALRGRPVLLVADDEQFARRGGMINFVLERNKVGFEINAEAMKRAKLSANAQILKLARTVY